LEISIDGAGNISARANSTTVGTLSIVRPFNQILILLYDESLFDSTSSTGIDVNSYSVRNMFADGMGAPGQGDIISVSGFGSQAPFVLNSVWNPGIAPVADQQYVWIVGIQNTSIPEPSSIALMGATFLAMLWRRR
jgi:hypothetical protein